jgi:ArsR family transcriptional regulator, arsenate/arsenite/antimonite-responsive transcriptional repressor
MSLVSCYGGPSFKPTLVNMTSSLSALPAGPAAAACCAPSAGLDPSLDAERIAAVAKALAEPLRVQIVDVLRRSEQQVCQCELLPLFGINQSLLSHHMKKLVDAGLVEVERRHRWAYYSVSPDALKELTAWLS